MTALIKQKWSDEMIPARVVDTASLGKFEFIIHDIQGDILFDKDGFMLFSNDCTLISRPFMVSDIVTTKAISAKLKIIELLPETPNIKACAVVLYNEDTFDVPLDMLVHVNPLWRAKSEDL
jgi:hypothetical protein